MTVPEIRNPVYMAENLLLIDVEYNHPELGWIPFTASPTDSNPVCVEIFYLAQAMGPAPYVAPLPMAYQLVMSEFWMRMADDDEYDAVLAAIQTGSPRANRQAFNVAQTLMSDSELFLWAKNLIKSAIGEARTEELLAPSSMSRS